METQQDHFCCHVAMQSDPFAPTAFKEAFHGDDDTWWTPSVKNEWHAFIFCHSWEKCPRTLAEKEGRKTIERFCSNAWS